MLSSFVLNRTIACNPIITPSTNVCFEWNVRRSKRYSRNFSFTSNSSSRGKKKIVSKKRRLWHVYDARYVLEMCSGLRCRGVPHIRKMTRFCASIIMYYRQPAASHRQPQLLCCSSLIFSSPATRTARINYSYSVELTWELSTWHRESHCDTLKKTRISFYVTFACSLRVQYPTFLHACTNQLFKFQCELYFIPVSSTLSRFYCKWEWVASTVRTWNAMHLRSDMCLWPFYVVPFLIKSKINKLQNHLQIISVPFSSERIIKTNPTTLWYNPLSPSIALQWIE